MQNFARGDQGFFAIQPTGGVATQVNITSHSLDLEVALFEVLNTGSGGVMARLVGRLDAKGTVNADFDLDLAAYLPIPNINVGVRGLTQFGLAPGRPIQIPSVIGKVHYEVAVTSQVKYSFDVSMDGRAGVVVYPAI
jgi:hypothetical protein